MNIFWQHYLPMSIVLFLGISTSFYQHELLGNQMDKEVVTVDSIQLGHSFRALRSSIYEFKNEIRIVALYEEPHFLGIWNERGEMLDSIPLKGRYIDLAFRNETYHTSESYLEAILLSEGCDSILVINKNKVYKNELLDLYFDWTAVKAGNFYMYESHYPFYKLTGLQQDHYFRTCADSYLSVFQDEEGVFYVAQVGSIYATSKRMTEDKYKPDNVWISKDLVFWDEIIHFDPINGNLIYFAPLSCGVYFDNVLDEKPANRIVDLCSNNEIVGLKEYERPIYEIGAYFDKEERLLYLYDIFDDKEFDKIKIVKVK